MQRREHLRSIWHSSFYAEPLDRLERDLRCEVAIVGAGITGLTAALELARAGIDVVLLERGSIGDGVTGRTTAHITALPDATLARIGKRYGEKAARHVATHLSGAIDSIASHVEKLGIDCGFTRCPGYFFAEKGQAEKEVAQEREYASRVGLAAASVPTIPLGFPVAEALRVEDQARFHPLPYLAGLARGAKSAGARIFGNARCMGYEGREPVVLSLEGGLKVQATHVVFATHTPLGIRLHHSAMKTYRSYVITYRVRGKLPDGLFFDAAEPYHYVRKQEIDGEELWIVGGSDHVVGNGDPERAFRELDAYARARYAIAEEVARWSSQLYETADELPYIGRALAPGNFWFATGYAGDGMTYGTLAGSLLARQIRGEATAGEELYSPKRFHPVAGTPKLMAEGMEVMKSLFVDRVLHADRAKLDDVPPGEGRIVRDGPHQLAVYRGEDGSLQACSAVCPHMKCVVHWNGAEKSWDCPCHGSRFDVDGALIEGPSLEDLEVIDLDGTRAKKKRPDAPKPREPYAPGPRG